MWMNQNLKLQNKGILNTILSFLCDNLHRKFNNWSSTNGFPYLICKVLSFLSFEPTVDATKGLGSQLSF